MRVLIACGGSAGHIFPGLALAEELKKEDRQTQIVFCISSHRRDKNFLNAAGSLLKELDIKTIDSMAWPDHFSFKYVQFSARLFLALCKSLIVILRCTPHVVVGFGGHTSFAPLVIARLIGIPTLIHEQNLIPGRANRILSRITNRIAITFDDTNKFFSGMNPGFKIVKTGLPLRKTITDCKRHARDILSRAEERFTILVVGGSQGAHRINELVLDCLGRIDHKVRQRLCVIHLTGKSDFHYIQSRYLGLGVSFRVFDFLEDIAGAYRVADLLIARSGAGTIFEAASFALPCLFIPYPWGTKHQIENARFLQRKGCALVLDQESATGADLEENLLRLIGNKRMRQELAQRISLLEVPQAGNKLKTQINLLYRGN